MCALYVRKVVTMELKMKMPDLSANEAEIKVVKWMIEPGQRDKRGQTLLEVETDKAISGSRVDRQRHSR